MPFARYRRIDIGDNPQRQAAHLLGLQIGTEYQPRHGQVSLAPARAQIMHNVRTRDQGIVARRPQRSCRQDSAVPQAEGEVRHLQRLEPSRRLGIAHHHQRGELQRSLGEAPFARTILHDQRNGTDSRVGSCQLSRQALRRSPAGQRLRDQPYRRCFRPDRQFRPS